MKLARQNKETVVRIDVYTKGYGKTFTVPKIDLLILREKLKSTLPEDTVFKLKNSGNKSSKPRKKVRVQFYEHTGSTKGKYRSFTVHHKTVDYVYNTIINSGIVKPYKVDIPTVVRVELLEKGKARVFDIDDTDPESVLKEIKDILPSQRKTYTFNPLEFKKPNKVVVRCSKVKGKKSTGGRKKTNYTSFSIYGFSKEEIFLYIINSTK